MPSMESFTTFSGIMAFLATVALLRGRYTIGATILIIAGAGGVAIFWDRWSREAGPHVQVQALLSPVMPTFEQFALLATHLPMLVAGLIILAITVHRANKRARGPHPEAQQRDAGPTTALDDPDNAGVESGGPTREGRRRLTVSDEAASRSGERGGKLRQPLG